MSTSTSSTQSALERRSAEGELRRLIAKFSPTHRRLVSIARRWLQKRLPAAYEVVYEYRDCFLVSYSPSERGYEGLFAVRGSADGIRLYFNRGKGLPDPGQLLQGSANLVRWIPLRSASTLALPAVERLFEEALARNPVPFMPAGRGPLLIRSTRAKAGSRRRVA